MTAWITVARVGDIARGAVLPVEVAGQPAVLYRDGDRYFAAQRRCPHAGFDLAEGFVSRGFLVCPLHLWRFATDTGIFEHWAGTCLDMFTVRVVGDAIEIDPTPHRNCPPAYDYTDPDDEGAPP